LSNNNISIQNAGNETPEQVSDVNHSGKPIKIYLAPLQGITDHVYRDAVSELFPELGKTYTPFIQADTFAKLGPKSLQNKLADKQKKTPVIPQLLSKDGERLASITDLLNSMGYHEINLNLGCPFPTVTGKGRGSALLPYPAKIDAILKDYFSRQKSALSLKIRLGYDNPDDWQQLIHVFNEYPLAEVIVHPRYARQMYSGDVYRDKYNSIVKECRHKVVYNGDICSLADYEQLCDQIAGDSSTLMIGRGIISAPFIIREICEKKSLSLSERLDISYKLICTLRNNFRGLLSGDTHYLQKMKNIVRHAIEPFEPEKKEIKKIVKCNNSVRFDRLVDDYFITRSSSARRLD